MFIISVAFLAVRGDDGTKFKFNLNLKLTLSMLYLEMGQESELAK